MNRRRSQRRLHMGLEWFMLVMLSRDWRFSTGYRIQPKSRQSMLNRSKKKRYMSGSKRSRRWQALLLIGLIVFHLAYNEISLYPPHHFGDRECSNALASKTLRPIWI